MCNHLDHNEIQQMICAIEDAVKAQLPDSVIEVTDPMGNGHHFEVTVHSAQFTGHSQVEQHRMVYAALKDLLAGELHSVVVRTKST